MDINDMSKEQLLLEQVNAFKRMHLAQNEVQNATAIINAVEQELNKRASESQKTEPKQ